MQFFKALKKSFEVIVILSKHHNYFEIPFLQVFFNLNHNTLIIATRSDLAKIMIIFRGTTHTLLI